MAAPTRFDALLSEIRACRHCERELPLGPRPILSVRASARLLIIGQAPGRRVHESGVPWDDASGERLREWLQLERATFYDEATVGILPMGFCYPGKGASGDLPPRPECAPLWHPLLLPLLRRVQLTLLVGSYAQGRVLAERAQATLTDTVRAFEDYLPTHFPLPHPSPRNAIWRKKNPWFERACLPELRRRVRAALAP